MVGLSERRIAIGRPVYRYVAHAQSSTMAATWTSHRNVHEAHLKMVATCAGERWEARNARSLRAFELVSRLAIARVDAAERKVTDAGANILAALATSPARWLDAMRLRGSFRGSGSGW